MASSVHRTWRSARAIAQALSKDPLPAGHGPLVTGATALNVPVAPMAPVSAPAAVSMVNMISSWHRHVSSSTAAGEGGKKKGDEAGEADTKAGKKTSSGAGSETHAERRKRRREEQMQRERASLATIDEEEFSAITDKIPQRPMTAVESTSYSLVILAALGFAAAVLYAAFSELLFSPKEYKCFSQALKKIEEDPRVTIRLGTPMKAYGSESMNRSARQRIPHRLYYDDQGREHVQLQFVAKGPSGRATVHADMYQEAGEANWRYHYLYLTVESPLPQQVVLVKPFQVDNE
jgi:import inner membrane translocase subunit TIM21